LDLNWEPRARERARAREAGLAYARIRACTRAKILDLPFPLDELLARVRAHTIPRESLLGTGERARRSAKFFWRHYLLYSFEFVKCGFYMAPESDRSIRYFQEFLENV